MYIHCICKGTKEQPKELNSDLDPQRFYYWKYGSGLQGGWSTNIFRVGSFFYELVGIYLFLRNERQKIYAIDLGVVLILIKSQGGVAVNGSLQADYAMHQLFWISLRWLSMNPLWSSVGSLGTLNFRYAPVVVQTFQ